jgi:hypothetical protein
LSIATPQADVRIRTQTVLQITFVSVQREDTLTIWEVTSVCFRWRFLCLFRAGLGALEVTQNQVMNGTNKLNLPCPSIRLLLHPHQTLHCLHLPLHPQSSPIPHRFPPSLFSSFSRMFLWMLLCVSVFSSLSFQPPGEINEKINFEFGKQKRNDQAFFRFPPFPLSRSTQHHFGAPLKHTMPKIYLFCWLPVVGRVVCFEVTFVLIVV